MTGKPTPAASYARGERGQTRRRGAGMVIGMATFSLQAVPRDAADWLDTARSS